MKIRIGTRKSPLALAQAEEVRQKLLESRPPLTVEIVSMSTTGDRLVDQSLTDVGGKGLFTKEIEEALQDGRVDLAVHSMKDMPTVLPDGLIIGCMLEREDPRDMLVGEGINSFSDIENGAIIGTSALRRSAQLLMKRPDLQMALLRGNVQTRLKKLEQGGMRATMLAAAGLNRLGLTDIPGMLLSIDEFLPAVAQGAIGVECRKDDAPIRDLLAPLAHAPTEIAVNCERAFLRALDGSCRTPIAGHAIIDDGKLWFRGLIIKPDGSAHHAIEVGGKAADAQAIGENAGKELLAKAGKDFIHA
jgi:hydroxymethylbilane synthase